MTRYLILCVKENRLSVGRLPFLICFLCLSTIVAAARSQPALSKKITIVGTDVSITTLISAIEKQCAAKVAYGDIVRNNHIKIDLRIRGEQLKTVLDKTLPRYGLSYAFVNNILVFKKAQKQLTKDTNSVVQHAAQIDTVPAYNIRSKVVDSAGNPLVGASVFIEGTGKGTYTDSTGNFFLQTSDSSVQLMITMTGYELLHYKPAFDSLDVIHLKLSDNQLNDIVIIGYGKQKKVDLTGSVATITGDDLSLKPVGQTSAALEGALPGVTVTQRNGRPGADGGTIRVRGIGTLRDNSDPLVLIDGIEGSINNIDPNTIATLTVLKDAASASIYGSRAANGVILVTTKRANSKSLTVNYNNYFGWQSPTDLPELAGATTFMELTNQAYVNAGRTPLYSDDLIAKYKSQGTGTSDSLPNTDWQKLTLTGSGFQQSHFLSVSAGTDRVKVLTSIGYLDQLGIMPNTEFKRLSIRSNADIKISEKLNLQFDLQFLNPITIQPSAGADGIVTAMNSISPNKLARNSNGKWGEGWIGLNPVAKATVGGIGKTSSPSGVLNAGLNYRPSDWLAINVNYAPKIIETQGNNFVRAIQTYFPDGSQAYLNPSLSALNVSHERDFYNNLRGTATFDKAFGLHHLKVMAGTEANSYKQTYFSASRDNFILLDYPVLNTGSADNLNNTGTAEEWSLLSFFGRINYDFDEKYLLEVNARKDGSSRFAQGRKWGFFPSISGGWRISEENFFQPWKGAIDEFKLRASWGQLGNQNIGTYPSVTTVELGSYSFGGNIVGVAALNGLANRNITWETTEMTDIGIDLSLFSHLTVTADYYIRNTRDILLQLNIPMIAGLEAPFQNAGKVSNKGWDLDISYYGAIGDFKYNIGANLSDVKNKVIDTHGINETDVTVIREGYPFNSIYGLQSDGFFKSEEEIANSATQYGTLAPGDIKYIDQNNDGAINQDDKVVLGNSIPRYTYGAHFNLSWKNLDLNVFIQGVGKADGLIYGGGLMPFFVTSAGGTVQEMYTDSWAPDNPDARFPRLVFGGSNNQQVSDFWMRSATYFRIKNIQIGYSLPRSLTSKFKMRNLRLFASANNFFTWDNFWTGYDVETAVGSAGNYPIVKVFTFGLSANF